MDGNQELKAMNYSHINTRSTQKKKNTHTQTTFTIKHRIFKRPIFGGAKFILQKSQLQMLIISLHAISSLKMIFFSLKCRSTIWYGLCSCSCLEYSNDPWRNFAAGEFVVKRYQWNNAHQHHKNISANELISLLVISFTERHLLYQEYFKNNFQNPLAAEVNIFYVAPFRYLR